MTAPKKFPGIRPLATGDFLSFFFLSTMGRPSALVGTLTYFTMVFNLQHLPVPWCVCGSLFILAVEWVSR
jgi:hypothetical protein